MDQNTTTKKSKLGLVGLILSITVLFTLGLTAIPAFLVCVFGLFKKTQRTLSCFGIVIIFIALFLLFINFIAMVPPEITPKVFNAYKFKKACSKAVFWLDYDREHIIELQSQKFLWLGCQGAIHYRSQPGTYPPKKVVEYAKQYGWTYHFPVTLYKTDFEKYDNNPDTEEYGNIQEVIHILSRSQMILKDDCIVLMFETGNFNGYASYIMISDKEDEMIVFYDNINTPDPPAKFWVLPCFEELSKERRNPKMEEVSK